MKTSTETNKNEVINRIPSMQLGTRLTLMFRSRDYMKPVSQSRTLKISTCYTISDGHRLIPINYIQHRVTSCSEGAVIR
uniref:Uncharacterized protein n=1 Tax=Arundo donax TaxID=35708 RepID=A0A0A8XRP2_ARUDO